MAAGPDLRGDSNWLLQEVQHTLFSEMIVRLFVAPRDRYLAAARLVGVQTELALRLAEMREFNHRALRRAYGRIAAHYRHAHDDGGQLKLGEDEGAYRNRLEEQWRAFFSGEVERLTSDEETVRALVTAAVYADTDRGYAAEAWIMELLGSRYENAPAAEA